MFTLRVHSPCGFLEARGFRSPTCQGTTLHGGVAQAFQVETAVGRQKPIADRHLRWVHGSRFVGVVVVESLPHTAGKAYTN